jgi:hypothetical protein
LADVSNKRWGSIREADYEDANDYCAACLVDLNAHDEEKKKENCKLPVREPKKMGGRLNRGAVHAAVRMLAGARGGVDVPQAEKRKAARKLVRLYRDLGEDHPTPSRSLRRTEDAELSVASRLSSRRRRVFA